MYRSGQNIGLDRKDMDAGTPKEVVEATYVDDEALYLAAPTAKRLHEVMGLSIEILIMTFHEHGFTINWKPGKM